MRPLPICRAAAPVALVVLATACGRGDSREVADFERMRQQQRYDPYEASALFADGMAMRTPPSGTVAHETADGPAVVATGVEHGAPTRRIPVSVTPERLAFGRRQFDIYCAVCHGADGSGRSLVADNMHGARPPSLLTPAVAAQPPGQLFALVSAGKGRMPAFAWALPPMERWAVIAYVRTLSGTTEPAAPTGEGPR